MLTKKPRLKIPININFWVARRFNDVITGSGRTKMITSVTILPPALIYQKGRFGIQVPGSSWSQNLSIGEQVKMTTRSCARDHRVTETRASITMVCIFRTAKTR